jgi:hypothetical protein
MPPARCVLTGRKPIMFREQNFNWNASDLVGSAEAKTAYFFTPDDLRLLSFQAFGGGIGCGAPRHFYQKIYAPSSPRMLWTKHG